jgi:hypothetical protein
MPEGTSFADLIRDKPDAGLLPRVLPEKMWTGDGQGYPATAAASRSTQRRSSTSSSWAVTCSDFTSAACGCGWPSCGDAAS